MKELEFDVSMTIEDYMDYNLTFLSKMSRIAAAVLFWLFPTVFICIAIGAFFDPKVEDKSAVIVILVFFGLSFLLSKLLVFLVNKLHSAQMRIIAKRQYKNSQKQAHYRFNESGIETKDELTKFFCVWKQIVKLSENENALYVFINQNTAFIVPKRIFRNIEELSEVKSLIAQQSGKEFRYKPLNRKLKR